MNCTNSVGHYSENDSFSMQAGIGEEIKYNSQHIWEGLIRSYFRKGWIVQEWATEQLQIHYISRLLMSPDHSDWRGDSYKRQSRRGDGLDTDSAPEVSAKAGKVMGILPSTVISPGVHVWLLGADSESGSIMSQGPFETLPCCLHST